MPPYLDLVFAASVLASVGVLYGHLLGRVRELEANLQHENNRINRLWTAYRRLVDMYYKYRRENSPEPPELEDIWKEKNSA